MSFLRALFVTCAAAFCLSGCLQVEKIIKVQPDGSGTIEETIMIPKAALATLQQMAGGAGKPLEIFDEARLKAAAVHMGEGVTYVSGKKQNTDAGEGFTAIYAFTDINKLKLDQNPFDAAPGAAGNMPPEKKNEPIVFHFSKGSPAQLTVAMPPPEFKPKALANETADDMAMQMMQQLLKDMKMTVALDVAGAITETNASYHEGSRVTLMQLDFNKVLADPAKFKALAKANPQTMQEARALLKDLDGVKIETLPEVKIAFQ